MGKANREAWDAGEEQSPDPVSKKTVKPVPCDSPDGRIVIRLVDRDGQLVRIGEHPLHFESVAAAIQAATEAGYEIV